MARPAKHGHHTREALLDAAEALLAEGGPPAVTVRGVADRVGESTRAVYSQFGSRAGLMGALAARGFQMLADLVNGLPVTDDPLADLVDVGVRAFRPFAIGRPQLFRITFHEISETVSRQPDAGPALRAAYESLATRFRHAIRTGRLPERPLEQYAFAFHALTSGLAANELSRQPPPVGSNFWRVAAGVDVESLWRVAMQAFVHGLAQTAPDQAP